MKYTELKEDIIKICKTNHSFQEKLQLVANYLHEHVTHYDWVGFYFNNENKRELKLGPYQGEPTDHTIIPFGKGTCGQVALSNETFRVDDVNEQDNYISCNINVKSELVVPFFVNGKNIGQIDIDSNLINAFNEEDEDLLTFTNQLLSKHYN